MYSRYFVIIRLTFILILKFVFNICFNMLFTLHNYHGFFLCSHKRDDFVVADR